MMTAFVVAYTALVLFSSMIESAAMPDNRILSPLYVPLVYLVVVGLSRATARRSPHARPTGPLRRTVVVACLLWLLYPAAIVGMYVSVRASYDTNVWHRSALAQWLNEKPPEGRLYSNQPWVAYLSSGKHTRFLSGSDLEGCDARHAGTQAPRCELAWFYGADRGKEHASRFLYDFFTHATAGRDPVGAKGLTGAVLDFMRRSGLASRGSSSEESLDPAPPSLPAEVRADVIDSFADGVLYSLTAELSTDP